MDDNAQGNDAATTETQETEEVDLDQALANIEARLASIENIALTLLMNSANNAMAMALQPQPGLPESNVQFKARLDCELAAVDNMINILMMVRKLVEGIPSANLSIIDTVTNGYRDRLKQLQKRLQLNKPNLIVSG